MEKKQLPAITVSTVTCEPFHASSKLTQNQTFVVRFTRGLVNSQRLSFFNPCCWLCSSHKLICLFARFSMRNSHPFAHLVHHDAHQPLWKLDPLYMNNTSPSLQEEIIIILWHQLKRDVKCEAISKLPLHQGWYAPNKWNGNGNECFQILEDHPSQ